jgi:hypothetical protein
MEASMLAEKFFLVLEMLISRETGRFPEGPATYPDGAPKVISQSRFVPINTTDASSRR